MKLAIVTWNTWKYQQIANHLPDTVEAEQVVLDIPEIQTNVLTEISRDKCLQAYKQLQQPCLVDDSGIYFHAFNKFPVALTKFLYQGIGLEGMRRMYVGVEDKSAVFQCVLSYMDATLDGPLQFVGEVEGTISFDRLGKEQEEDYLPYDLIFIPEGCTQPALFQREKRLEINHRVRATEKLGAWLQQQ